MKIKADFITNSSSVSYVVCLPNNKEWILERLPQSDSYGDGIEEGLEISELENMTSLLLQEEALWEGENVQWYNSIVDLCRKNGFIIIEFDVGSEGGQIMNLTSEKVTKMAGILGIDWVKKVTNGRGEEGK